MSASLAPRPSAPPPADDRAALARFAAAVEHSNAGRLAEAEAGYREALRLRPALVEAQRNLGLTLVALGRAKEALALLAPLARRFPRAPEAQVDEGNALLALERWEAAAVAYERALALSPDYAVALNNLGGTYKARHDYERAAALFQQAVAAQPDYLHARANLCLVLRLLRRWDDAEAALRDALARHPESAPLHAHLASLRYDRADLAGAERAARHALSLDERCTDAWIALANCAGARLDLDEAVACLDLVLALKPASADARFNRALARLARRDYVGGWADYEARWQLGDLAHARRAFAEPRWDGSALDGRTILLYAEQGLGDVLQFVRYVRVLKARWRARVVLECDASLVALLSACDALDAVVAAGAELPAFDVHAPLLSLPHLLGGADEAAETVPYLRAVPRPVAERVRPGAVLNVGVVWGGRTSTPMLAQRTVGLPLVEALADLPGVRLFSLQVGPQAAELAASPLRARVTDLSPELHDFVDTAAAIARLDLVVTIDTSVAHLAGALGCPVWVLLIHAADWRWQERRADSPWYPSARLFRQPARGDWAPVLAEVRAALAEATAAYALEELTVAAGDADPEPVAPVAGLAPVSTSDEARCFLDDVLRDGDHLVDVGGDLAAHVAATGRRVRVTSVRRAAEGALDAPTADDAGGRVLLHVAAAGALTDLLPSAATLLADARLQAVAWRCRVDDDGAPHPADAMALGALEAFGFTHLTLQRDAEGPVLVPFAAAPSATVLSLAPAMVRAGEVESASEERSAPGSRLSAAAVAVAESREPRAESRLSDVPLAIDWQVGTSTGWGVYGLNLLLRWTARGGAVPRLAVAPDLRGAGPIQRHLLTPLAAAASGAPQPSWRDAVALRGLGNGLVGSPSSPPGARRNVGVVFFEDTRLDRAALERARAYDRIVAGSSWNAELLRAHGVEHVVVALQGVDPTVFHPAPRGGWLGDRFVVFSGGKLEYRKGQDLVVAAFRRFQARHPDALLMVAWHNHWPQSMAELPTRGHVRGVPALLPDGRLDVTGWLAANGVPAHAVLDLGLVPNAMMGALVREADVALFPNRGEGGTNLVAMEALACGVPTILSANTGHRDLLPDTGVPHCYPLLRQGPVRATAHFAGTDGWGESDVEEIVAALEAAYADRADAAARGARGAALLGDLAWPRQIDRLIASIADLF